MHGKEEDTESVLAGPAATEKSVPRTYWEEKKMGQLANMNPGGGKVMTWVMKQLSESSQISGKVCDRTEGKKEIEGVNGVSLRGNLTIED